MPIETVEGKPLETGPGLSLFACQILLSSGQTIRVWMSAGQREALEKSFQDTMPRSPDQNNATIECWFGKTRSDVPAKLVLKYSCIEALILE